MARCRSSSSCRFSLSLERTTMMQMINVSPHSDPADVSTTCNHEQSVREGLYTTCNWRIDRELG